MTGVAGATIATGAVQPAVGVYVQDALNPSADTNYVGVNTSKAWKTNVIEEDYAAGWIAPVNDNPATGGTAAWVKAAGIIAKDGRCNIVAGVATANASGTNICLVEGGVVADDFFWAPVFATTLEAPLVNPLDDPE